MKKTKVEVINKVSKSGLLKTYLCFHLLTRKKYLEINRDGIRYSDLSCAAQKLIDCLSSFGSEAFDPIARELSITIDWHYMLPGQRRSPEYYITREQYLSQWFCFQ